MRNTCAQSGECQFCGKDIYRTTPIQPWMDVDDLNTVCEGGNPHKPKPF
jgi:hypothetical protein